jgi:hypothetical protein
MAMSSERKAERAAKRKREKYLNSLHPIANRVVVLTPCSTSELSTVEVHLPEGAHLKGIIRDVNPVLEKLGYRPVRTTSNMLNPDSRVWCVDINTPAYLDPGSESYHSA